MKEVTTILILFLAISSFTTYSQEKLELEGAIIIQHSEDATPAPGTIRFNPATCDFEGWNGAFWASLSGFPLGSVTDIDGNIYKTVTIGTQEWMVENLRTTTFDNNNAITLIGNDAAGDAAWNTANYGAYCVYDTVGTGYSSFDVNEFGYLYNWYAVNDGSGLCPTGWHVPTDAEWTTLTNFLGGSGVAGDALKETGTTHWNNPNMGATNASGFTGLPGGIRDPSGAFSEIGSYGYWWSGGLNWCRYLYFNDASVGQLKIDQRFGFSVRCVRD